MKRRLSRLSQRREPISDLSAIICLICVSESSSTGKKDDSEKWRNKSEVAKTKLGAQKP